MFQMLTVDVLLLLWWNRHIIIQFNAKINLSVQLILHINLFNKSKWKLFFFCSDKPIKDFDFHITTLERIALQEFYITQCSFLHKPVRTNHDEVKSIFLKFKIFCCAYKMWIKMWFQKVVTVLWEEHYHKYNKVSPIFPCQNIEMYIF